MPKSLRFQRLQNKYKTEMYIFPDAEFLDWLYKVTDKLAVCKVASFEFDIEQILKVLDIPQCGPWLLDYVKELLEREGFKVSKYASKKDLPAILDSLCISWN